MNRKIGTILTLTTFIILVAYTCCLAVDNLNFDGYKVGDKFVNNGYQGKKLISTGKCMYKADVKPVGIIIIATLNDGTICNILKLYKGSIEEIVSNISTEYNLNFDLMPNKTFPLYIALVGDSSSTTLGVSVRYAKEVYKQDNGELSPLVEVAVFDRELMSKYMQEQGIKKFKL